MMLADNSNLSTKRLIASCQSNLASRIHDFMDYKKDDCALPVSMVHHRFSES